MLFSSFIGLGWVGGTRGTPSLISSHEGVTYGRDRFDSKRKLKQTKEISKLEKNIKIHITIHKNNKEIMGPGCAHGPMGPWARPWAQPGAGGRGWGVRGVLAHEPMGPWARPGPMISLSVLCIFICI